MSSIHCMFTIVTLFVAGQIATAGSPHRMRWVPPGEFTMGTDDPDSMPNERPAHHVKLDGFWMDETSVTNAQFRAFVEATAYVTTAEKPVDWEELKKQVPPGTPKPPDEMLQPGSLVFTPPDHPVNLRDMSNCGSGHPAPVGDIPRAPEAASMARTITRSSKSVGTMRLHTPGGRGNAFRPKPNGNMQPVGEQHPLLLGR